MPKKWYLQGLTKIPVEILIIIFTKASAQQTFTTRSSTATTLHLLPASICTSTSSSSCSTIKFEQHHDQNQKVSIPKNDDFRRKAKKIPKKIIEKGIIDGCCHTAPSSGTVTKTEAAKESKAANLKLFETATSIDGLNYKLVSRYSQVCNE